MLEITMKSGLKILFKKEEYTDYKYDGKSFIVIYHNQWVGLFNLDSVEYVMVDRMYTE